MLEKLKQKKAAVYLVIMMLLNFCLCQYGLQRIFGFSLFPDEFGYWAPAAGLLGWDWSDTASLGSYYSFGYSLILAPLLYFFEDSVIAYRAAIVINMVLMCAGLVLLYQLLRKLFPETDKGRLAVVSAASTLYPPWIFYMQMTMTEGCLLFLYILICWLYLHFLEKPKRLHAVLFAAALAYIYFVHMRCIGVAVAGGLALTLWALKNKNAEFRTIVIASLICLLILFMIGLGIKNGLLDRLYDSASGEILRHNDYSGQWGKLARLFRLEGWKAFLTGCVGKILYLGLSTYGLAYWAIYGLFKKAVGLFHGWRRGEAQSRDFFWLFLCLSTAAQFMVTVVYTIDSASAANDRLDLLVHGRYSELIVPILIAFGILQALDTGRLWLGTGLSIAGTAISTGIVSNVAGANHLENVHGYFMIGMSYLLKEEAFQPSLFLWKAWAFGSCLMILTAVILTACKRKRHAEWPLTMLLLLQAALGIQAGEHYIYIGNSYGYGDVRIADKLSEVSGKDGEGRVIHIYEGDEPYIGQVQFRLRDQKIIVWNTDTADPDWDEIQAADKVIVGADSGFKQELEERYEKSWEAGHLCLYYNP